jgi:hypothetical protein
MRPLRAYEEFIDFHRRRTEFRKRGCVFFPFQLLCSYRLNAYLLQSIGGHSEYSGEPSERQSRCFASVTPRLSTYYPSLRSRSATSRQPQGIPPAGAV